jgi:hypothetical protein
MASYDWREKSGSPTACMAVCSDAMVGSATVPRALNALQEGH